MNEYGSVKQGEFTLETKLLHAIKKNSQATNKELAAMVGSTEKRVMEYISKMKKKNMLVSIRVLLAK